MPIGQLTATEPQSAASATLAPAVEVDVAPEELAKLVGFVVGMPVLIEAVVRSVPRDGRVPASYPAFRLEGVSYGLTAITSPPPERDTTVVRLDVGQRIALRIAGEHPQSGSVTMKVAP